MTQPFAAEYPIVQAKDRIIVALDVTTAAAARELVAEVAGEVGAFKIGSQLFTAAGPGLVSEFTKAGHKIFLDLKFHDIPNTVAGSAAEAARLGVWMFNVHALGGSEMMKRAAEEVRNTAESEGSTRPLIIAVTVLTSSDDATLGEVGIDTSAAEQVLRLARLASDSGLDGVVASAREAAAIRQAVNTPGFVVVTPGIRASDATIDDQKRVTTVAKAFASGSDYVVIGRPITHAADRVEAIRKFVGEVKSINK